MTTKLLLVDDDRLVLTTLASGLRTAGYDVTEATSGQQAITLLEQTEVNLAVLDMRMPGLSGVDVARWLKLHKHIPFIFLSAYSDQEVVETAIREGAFCYLVKPMDTSQVAPAIEAALARSADLDRTRENENRLNCAIKKHRRTSVAVGILMERHRVPRDEAFSRLRGLARRRRQALDELAAEVVTASELMDSLGCGRPPHEGSGKK